MKRWSLLLLLSLLGSLPVAAQFTAGTGTVSDSAGSTYASATVSCIIAGGSSGAAKTINGSPVPSPVTATANGSGVVTMSLADNSIVQPTQTKWSCTVIAAAGAPQFTTSFNIAGTSATLPFAGKMPLPSSLAMVPFAGAPSGSCQFLQQAINTSTSALYTCSSTAPGTTGSWVAVGGGGGSGTVTEVDTTSPISGGPITTSGAVACPTCGVTGSPLSEFAATTSAQLAGVLSDETGTGVAVFGTAPTISGHPTIEGVTSTGATGTGKLVFDTAPTLSNPVVGTQSLADNSTKAASTAYADRLITPIYSTAKTGISMISGVAVNTNVTGGECTSGICTMTTPGADGTYIFYYTMYITAAGSGGTCTTGTMRLDLGYKAANGATYGTTTPGPAMSTVGIPQTFLSTTAAITTSGAVSTQDWVSVPRMFLAKSGTAITFAVEEIAGNNCTVPPVFTVRPVLFGPFPF